MLLRACGALRSRIVGSTYTGFRAPRQAAVLCSRAMKGAAADGDAGAAAEGKGESPPPASPTRKRARRSPAADTKGSPDGAAGEAPAESPRRRARATPK